MTLTSDWRSRSGEVMPKQPNHPHHHSRAERARRQGGLRLPQIRWSMWRPYYVYPPGWVRRQPWKSVAYFYLLYLLGAIIVVAAIFTCVGGTTLWQALTGSR